MLEAKRKDLLANLDAAHDAYYKEEIFGGPSLHFHAKSLEAAHARELGAFSECIYATLAAWGMHRMGKGGSKMRDFKEFQTSLKSIWSPALKLQNRTPGKLDERDWGALENIFKKIRCMASGTSLVGNSKVMAHLLPNLVPPVDREYTLKYLFSNGQIKNDLEAEWKTLATILKGFFYPLLNDPEVQSRGSKWMAARDAYRWDTSMLKIIDNLVIGRSKMLRAERNASGHA